MDESIAILNDGYKNRPRNPELWARNINKKEHYRPTGAPIKSCRCKHRHCLTFQCNTLDKQDIQEFYDGFYRTPTKVHQDSVILMYARAEKCKQPRKSYKGVRGSLSYFVPTKEGQKQVCANAFCNILQINVQRVQRLVRKQQLLGIMPKDMRGGDRKSTMFDEKKRAVEKFIRSLRGTEAHYRRETTKKIYMPSTLSVAKLWRMYNATCQENERVHEFSVVSLSFIRGLTLFSTSFCFALGAEIIFSKNI